MKVEIFHDRQALVEALKEADAEICKLCKRLNPQHATADCGKGCNWCEGREVRLKLLATAEEGRREVEVAREILRLHEKGEKTY